GVSRASDPQPERHLHVRIRHWVRAPKGGAIPDNLGIHAVAAPILHENPVPLGEQNVCHAGAGIKALADHHTRFDPRLGVSRTGEEAEPSLSLPEASLSTAFTW